jgi:phage-related tail fiber protein
MKKLLFAFTAVALTFTACKKDETTDPITKKENPVLTFTSTSGETVEAGSSLLLNISIRANDDGDKLKTVVVTRGSEDIPFFTISDVNETSLDSIITVEASLAFETTSYTLVATDKNNHIASKTITIKTVSGFNSDYSGEFYHISAPSLFEGAYDFVNDVRVSSSQNDSLKDMIHGEPVGVFTGSWSSNNGTMYVKANNLDFSSTTRSTMVSHYATFSGTASAGAYAPAGDDIYIAKLRGNQGYALIKITANEPDNAECGCTTNTGKLSFNYKK